MYKACIRPRRSKILSYCFFSTALASNKFVLNVLSNFRNGFSFWVVLRWFDTEWERERVSTLQSKIMDLRVNTCTYVYARHQQFSLALSSAPQRKQAFCNLLSLVNITKTLFHYPYLYLCFAFVYLFSHATIICSGKFIRDSTSLMLLVLKQVVKIICKYLLQFHQL